MRLRALGCVLAVSTVCASACSPAEAGAPWPEPTAGPSVPGAGPVVPSAGPVVPGAGPPVATAAPAPRLPAGRITPVTTLFVAEPSRPAGDVAPPWSLTASDGSGLVLTRIDARAVVEGPLAFTELHLYFHNPELRVREGTFSITLPGGAAVSRFAMENAGQFVEAEVVEKQRARQVYEDFLHRRQDPALLEKAAGNQFSARVFPIPAGADKHLVIGYAQDVTPGRYTLPLRGLPRSQRVDVRVQVRGASGGVAEQTMRQRDWLPDRDVVVDAAAIGAPVAIAAGELAAVRLPIALQDAAAPPAAVTLLVDTSASRGLGFAAQAREVRALIDELARAYGGGLAVQVVAFDQSTAPVYDGRADHAGGVEAALIARGALGASDLGQALDWLAGHAPRSRVVVVTDGVITAGASGDALAGKLRALGPRGVGRVDVALTGGIRDDQAAAAIARAGLAHAGAVLDLDRGAGEAARRIGLAVRTGVAVTADGARWVFPRAIEAAQAGDEVTVYVRRGSPGQSLAVTVGDARTVVAPVAVPEVLLGRAFAGAEIAELERRLAAASAADADGLRAELARRSVAARVVSSETAMLVLESDADFARYGIDRRALADILAIGPSGIELLHRAAPAQIAAPASEAPRTATATQRDGRDGHGGRDKERAEGAVVARPAASARPAIPDAAPEPRVGGAGDVGGTRSAGDAGSRGARDIAASRSAGAALDRRERPRAVDPAPAAPAPAEEAKVAVSTSGAIVAHGSGLGGAAAPSPRRVARVASPELSRADAVPPAPPPAPAAAAVSSGLTEGAIHGGLDASGGVSMAATNGEIGDDDMAVNSRAPALQGPLAEIERALATGRADDALARARAWHQRSPGDVLALIGLGDALEARRELDTAARAYGSIIDLYPARADLRRFAGERLERLGRAQRALIIDTYRRAVEQRPDHLTGHRLLAYALVRDGQYAAAFAAILAGLDRPYPGDRFAGGARVLHDDAGILAATYMAHVPGVRDEVMAQLDRRRIAPATQPSTRFVLYWETDNNDVDFHVRDARGGHAWYSHPRLGSGGELYADVTTGYGPECFAIPGVPRAAPYRLSIHYYAQGPMGYGMGLLQILTFDGKGNLRFEDRPYVIMTDHAFVDLGAFR